MADVPKTLGDVFSKANPTAPGLNDTGLSAILKALAASPFPPAPPIIQDRWFKDENVFIDGYTFQRCRFDRCRLITEWATYAFENCFISVDCVLYFKGPALKTVQLLSHHWRNAGRIELRQGEEGLAATINPDGTFTLK